MLQFPLYLGSYLSSLVEAKANQFSKVRNENEAILLAGEFGITIYYLNFCSLKGLLLQANDKVIVGINKELPEVLRVKSILHEIGHYVLHDDNRLKPVFADWHTMFNREEREADYFAWCLMSERLKEEYLEYSLIK
ncbi:ImmA/IrrE family metallo-endopeptidase [Candidatus Sordicultor fermentans]|uniref:ImmA/IrrE family metallo-endopeptidase n=1 Tax=Candidatus Sordicultor fermentans TaxID=1953203 RepID=UPI0039089D29